MIKMMEYGSTLKLIGTIIATVAACCYDSDEFLNDAKILLQQTEEQLKHSEPQMIVLRSIINNGCQAENIKKIIELLPFNYH